MVYKKGGKKGGENEIEGDIMQESPLDSLPSAQSENGNSNWQLTWTKNTIIVILIVLLILSFLGVNLFLILGRIIQIFTQWMGPFANGILDVFGYTTGMVINQTANVVSDTAKVGIDIADGTAHSIGNLFLNASNVKGNLPIQQINGALYGSGPLIVPTQTITVQSATQYPITSAPPTHIPTTSPPALTPTAPTLNSVLNNSQIMTASPMPIPSADTTSSSIQNTIASSKGSWCLVGDYNGKRGCVEVNDSGLCMSEKLYANQQECLNLYPRDNSGANVSTTLRPKHPTFAAGRPIYGNGTAMMQENVQLQPIKPVLVPMTPSLQTVNWGVPPAVVPGFGYNPGMVVPFPDMLGNPPTSCQAPVPPPSASCQAPVPPPATSCQAPVATNQQAPAAAVAVQPGIMGQQAAVVQHGMMGQQAQPQVQPGMARLQQMVHTAPPQNVMNKLQPQMNPPSLPQPPNM